MFLVSFWFIKSLSVKWFLWKTISKLLHLKAFYKIRHLAYLKTIFLAILGDENLSDYVFGAIFLVFAINSFCPFPFKESNFLVVGNRNLFNNFIFQSLLGFFCDFFYFWPLSLVIFISYSLMEYEYVFTSHILIFLWFTVALQFIKMYNAPYLLLQIWIIRSLPLISR